MNMQKCNYDLLYGVTGLSILQSWPQKKRGGTGSTCVLVRAQGHAAHPQDTSAAGAEGLPSSRRPALLHGSSHTSTGLRHNTNWGVRTVSVSELIDSFTWLSNI